MNQQVLNFDDSTVVQSLPPQPEAALGKTPQVKNTKQLATALACIAAIDARSKSVEAQRKAEVDAVNNRWANQLQIQVGKTVVPCEQYRALLIGAIEDFVPENKSEVFPDGKQTARFASGEISFKEKQPEVIVDQESKAKEIADALAKKKKLQPALEQLLESFKLNGWLRLKWELDLSAIKRQFKDGKIDKRKLPKGLIVSEKSEPITIKPLTSPERSEAA